MEETLVFIDAGFLAKLSRYFGNGEYINFDIVDFARKITRKQELSVKHIFYGTAPPFQGTPPTEDERKRKLRYDRFKTKLSNKGDFTFLEGRVQRLKLSDGKFKYSQKGVDTVLTMALSSSPAEFIGIKKYVLIACDTDFVPVIKMLRSKGIEIILASYYEKKRNTEFSRSHHLIDVCSDYTKLTKEDFEKARLNEPEGKQ